MVFSWKKITVTASHEQLEPGSSIKFLRRKMVETEDGLVPMPGTTLERVVSIQLTDNSPKLNARDSSMFRSIIGLFNHWT